MDILNFRVSPDGHYLEIWVEVPEGKSYESIEIDKVAVVDYKAFEACGGEYPSDDFIYKKEFTQELNDVVDMSDLYIPKPYKRFVKRIDLKQSPPLMQIQKSGMYYLFVKIKGLESFEAANIPCCCMSETTIACAINHYPIYNTMLKIINSYQDRCLNATDKLLDLYLKKKLITDAVEISDYTTANKIFNDLYKREIGRGECLNGCYRPNSGIIYNHSGNKCTTCG